MSTPDLAWMYRVTDGGLDTVYCADSLVGRHDHTAGAQVHITVTLDVPKVGLVTGQPSMCGPSWMATSGLGVEPE
ncbi:hypothetical protein LTR56_027107 [Elasticomyces elasticus]|nr:hypothetical protein LTR56_027107 [Elasticomyces elasticus]